MEAQTIPAGVILLVGESGSGKSYAEKKICMLACERYRSVISHTSRNIRSGESDGLSYYFKDKQWMRQNKERFAEINDFHGNYYGVSIAELLKDNRIPVAVVEPKGAADIELWANKYGMRTFIVRFMVHPDVRRENISMRDGSDSAFFKRAESDKSMTDIFNECKLVANLIVSERRDDVDSFILSNFDTFMKSGNLLSSLFADNEQMGELKFTGASR